MEGCEHFEVAIEERRLGTLDGGEVTRLDEHVASCPSCRQFASFVRHSEETMTTADATLNDVDWAGIKKTLRAAPVKVRDQLLLYMTAFLAAAPLIAQSVGGDVRSTLLVLLGCIPAAFVLRYSLALPLVREMEWIGTRDADFFDQYRALIDRQMRSLRRMILFFPIWALALDAIGWYTTGRGEALTVCCRTLLIVVASLWSAWLHRVPLRRLRQIRTQLS